ncbi:MAG: metallophosphoesterase [Myxococcaceae bacterium]|nr:metallophosphoesterase [Myxococcaceae bacterium]
MKILHLSDLHLTDPFENFEQVWLPVQSAVRSHRSFDAVVVSGDLTQSAQRPEYDRLEKFLETTILPLVEGRREAVVLVPGNHDVDWNARISSPVSLAGLGADAAREVVREALRPPGRDRYRLRISPLGHLEVQAISTRDYASRFAHLQRFLRNFYRGVGRTVRPFHVSDRDHWSAHLFPKHRVAIYGFNSACSNDAFWTGASLSAVAISEAGRHAREKAPDFVKVAVWHHGLSAEKGRSDLLTLTELGYLYHAGFRVGFHGHTHRDELALLDEFLGERFAVIATGSLGAGAAERPDAVGNQFSIVHLHPGQVRVQTFERRGQGYGAPVKRTLRLPRPTAQPSTAEAARHRRTWTIDPSNGLVSCLVELEDLHARGRVVLARPSEPHGHAIGDSTVETPTGKHKVHREQLSGGAQRFSLVADELIPDATWSYRVSNSTALSKADRQKQPEPIETHIALDEDSFSHSVRFPCDRLVLRVRVRGPGARAVMGPARVLVEFESMRDGEPTRILDPDEADRCTLTDLKTEKRLEVEAPLVGHRYSVVFKLASPGVEFSDGMETALENALQTCRQHRGAEEIRRRLVDAIRKEGRFTLNDEATWLCLLWSGERRRLLPAFGVFPEPSWNVRFPSGEGVAGHAFRFGKPAFWKEGAGGEHSLIYRDKTEVGSPFMQRYTWICCFPLLSANSCPIGVLSFAGATSSTPRERQLERMAAELCSGGRALAHQATTLWDALNRGFWTGVAAEKELDARTRELAFEVLKSRAKP